MDGGCGLQTSYNCKCWVLVSVHVGQYNSAKVSGEQPHSSMCFLLTPLASAVSVTLALCIKPFDRTCSHFSTVAKCQEL